MVGVTFVILNEVKNLISKDSSRFFPLVRMTWAVLLFLLSFSVVIELVVSEPVELSKYCLKFSSRFRMTEGLMSCQGSSFCHPETPKKKCFFITHRI